MKTNYFQFRKVGIFTPAIQIVLLAAFFVAQSLLANLVYRQTGSLFNYPIFAYWSILFAPIYEEIIFRGFIFSALLQNTTTKKAFIFGSVLFGLWHTKNIFFMDQSHFISQIIYPMLVFGPIMYVITYKTKTIWIGSIVHYANNFFVFLFSFIGFDWGLTGIKQLLLLLK